MNNKGVIIAICVGTVVLIVGVILGWAVIPNIVTQQIGENVELKSGTDQYDRFKKIPLPFNFKVYMFNIKNLDEVKNGGQPIMEEIGPYVYKQTREKQNITRDEDEHTISYYEYQNYEFLPNESGEGLSDSDEFATVNPALNGIVQMIESLLPSILPTLNGFVDKVFDDKELLIQSSVKKFLFEGLTICDQTKIDLLPPKDKSATNLICALLYAIPARNIKPLDSHLKFSFINHKNTTHDGRYTIIDGIEDKEDLALIKRWENSDHLTNWFNDEVNGTEELSVCNKVGGRDSTIYPPSLKSDEDLKIFNTDICRTIDITYNKDITFRDVTAWDYSIPADIFDIDSKRNPSCYCLNKTKGINEANGCLKSGALDLFSCYTAPIVLTFPHFLHAHDDYKNSVKGMSPDEEKHRTFIHVEPVTGSPLEGSKRVQFNMFIRNIAGIDSAAKFNTPYLVPILWLDENVQITDDLYDILYDQYVSKLVIIDGVRYSLIAVGAFIVVVTLGIFCWKDRRGKQTV